MTRCSRPTSHADGRNRMHHRCHGDLARRVRMPLGAASAVAGLALLIACTMPSRAEMEHVKVAIPSQIVDFSAEYIAEDMFYKDQGLDVTPLAIAGVGSMNAVISGSVEFSYSSGGSLTRAASRGQRLLAI